MARYRKVDTRIWNDAKFRALSERGKLIFFFLLTHPNQTSLGAMRSTFPGLAAEIKMPVGAFRRGFLESAAQGMVEFDEAAAFIWFPNFLKYNQPESPNVVRAWTGAFDLLPECSLKDQLFETIVAIPLTSRISPDMGGNE